jgi:hypothetical protein
MIHCKHKPCKAYRELPVIQFSQGKTVFITGNPVLIAGILFSLQGFPCKPLYFPVRDCSVGNMKILEVSSMLKLKKNKKNKIDEFA